VVRAWLWWLRFRLVLGIGAVWLMHELGPLALFLGGVLFGIVLDRFVLWPLAVVVAKLDGRFRSG
jgi:hypothetical protein